MLTGSSLSDLSHEGAQSSWCSWYPPLDGWFLPCYCLLQMRQGIRRENVCKLDPGQVYSEVNPNQTIMTSSSVLQVSLLLSHSPPSAPALYRWVGTVRVVTELQHIGSPTAAPFLVVHDLTRVQLSCEGVTWELMKHPRYDSLTHDSSHGEGADIDSTLVLHHNISQHFSLLCPYHRYNFSRAYVCKPSLRNTTIEIFRSIYFEPSSAV